MYHCTTQLYSALAPLICRALPQLHYTYITHVHTISDWHARQDAVAIFGGLPIIIHLAIIIYQTHKSEIQGLVTYIYLSHDGILNIKHCSFSRYILSVCQERVFQPMKSSLLWEGVRSSTHRLPLVYTTFLSGFATSLIDYIGGGVQLQRHAP